MIVALSNQKGCQQVSFALKDARMWPQMSRPAPKSATAALNCATGGPQICDRRDHQNRQPSDSHLGDRRTHQTALVTIDVTPALRGASRSPRSARDHRRRPAGANFTTP